MDCESKNPFKYGTLASSTDEETNEFLVKLTFDPAWIGGNDLVEEGTWVWTDGSPWNYKNWAENEPNNEDTTDRDNEGNFLMLNGRNRVSFWVDDDGKWDFWESDRNGIGGYICQYDPTKSPKKQSEGEGHLIKKI